MSEEEKIKKIRDRIIAQAKKKADEIINEAEREAKRIIEEAISEAKHKAEVILRRGVEESQAYKRRKIAEATLKWRIEYIKSREKFIEEVFRKANEELQNLVRTDKYRKVIKNLILDALNVLGSGEYEVIIAGDTAVSIDLNEIARLSKEKLGIDVKLSMASERVRSMGGVIVRTKDLSFVVDNTFEARLKRMYEPLRVQVARMLFK
ncbi:MAG: V-type ATP synthase subunit E [Candidatus Baldrarchaeia archaeon]